jgi:hypothetical protein
MPRGGYRPGSGAKKGMKYAPRGKRGESKHKRKFIKRIIQLLNARAELLDREKRARCVFICCQCGKEFIPGIKQGPKKYCCAECQRNAYSDRRWKEMICEECGTAYRTQNGNTSKYCSLACFGKADSRRRKAERPAHHCKKCGKVFFREKRAEGSYVYCSRKCAGNGVIGKAKTPRNWRAGNYRKRARINGVPYEAVDISAVFERDGWRCQICGKATPKENRGTRRSNAPEIDHRVPMSKGGGHTYDNVQ